MKVDVKMTLKYVLRTILQTKTNKFICVDQDNKHTRKTLKNTGLPSPCSSSLLQVSLFSLSEKSDGQSFIF